MAIKTISKNKIEVISIQDDAINIDAMLGDIKMPNLSDFVKESYPKGEKGEKQLEQDKADYDKAFEKYDAELGKTKWHTYRITYNTDLLIFKDGHQPTIFVYRKMNADKMIELDHIKSEVTNAKNSLSEIQDISVKWHNKRFIDNKLDDFYKKILKYSLIEIKNMQADDNSYYNKELKNDEDFNWLFEEIDHRIIKELADHIYWDNDFSEEDKKKLESLLLSNTKEK